MEMDLNDLINKIQADGVNQAERKAREILEAAEKQAQEIEKQAEEKAYNIIEAAKKEVDQYEKASINTISQASRDVLLSLRIRVQEFFSRVVKEEVANNLSTEVIKEAIIKIADKFSPEKEIEVLFSEEDKESLKNSLIKALHKRSAEIKKSDKIEKGFRIGEKGKNAFFDFSDEAITEAFMTFLNPSLVQRLDIDLGIEEEQKKDA